MRTLYLITEVFAMTMGLGCVAIGALAWALWRKRKDLNLFGKDKD